MTPSTTRDTTTISKMGLTIVVGLLKLKVRRQNHPVGSAPPRANRARDKATQTVASSWHTRDPIKENPASSSFVSESRSGGFLHTPPCGLASSHPSFPAMHYPGKLLETTWPGFDGGDISPCLVLQRGTCPGWLSPVNNDLGSTQHHDAKS
jgi:hypothetical protein